MIEIIPNWHPLFVHFTVALLSLSVIFYIIQLPFAESEIGDNFLLFARYSLWLGVFFSLITLAAGWDAYNTVDHDTPSHTAMTDHRNWGLATVAVFFVLALWSFFSQRIIHEKATIPFLLILIIAGGLLVTTGHKGSLLVYFHGLGVESLPAKDDHTGAGGGHDHSHGEEAGKSDHKDGAHSHDEGGHDKGGHEDAHDDHAKPHAHDDIGADDHHSSSASMGSVTRMETPDDMRFDDDLKTSPHEPIGRIKPKIETYEDGTTREVLPAVEMTPGH